MNFKLTVVAILFALPLTAESGKCELAKITGDRFLVTAEKVHTGFIGAIRRLDSYAKACRVKIDVVHAFMKEDVGNISGAILNPSKRGNHFVGHAIDINVIDGKTFCNSRCLGDSSKQTKGVICFIAKVRGHNILRWGGDFTVTHPGHIDSGCNVNWPSVCDKLYRSLQSNC